MFAPSLNFVRFFVACGRLQPARQLQSAARMTNGVGHISLLVCALALPACRSSSLTNGTQPITCPSAHGATLLASWKGNVDAMLSDDDNLYWLDKFWGTVSFVPVAGGSVTTLATFPTLWSGPCGQPGFSVDCLQASIAADDANIYAAGPLGIYTVPKAGGTPRAIMTYDGKSAYMFGPIVIAGGALYWQEADIVTEDGELTENVRILQLSAPASTSAAPLPFPSDGEAVSSSAILTSDGSNLYWMGSGDGNGDAGIRTAPLAGGAATTFYASDTLAVENMTFAGGKLVWANQQIEGGPAGGAPFPTQSPNELVQALAASGGTPASLMTFPQNTDPGVTVLGDAHFAYAAVFDFDAGTSAIMAAKLTGGAAKTVINVPDLAMATLDSCNLYYFTSDQTIEKIGKPSP